MAELLEPIELNEALASERGAEVPPFPPSGLDTALYEHDERDSRRQLRRQIAALEAELGRLFASAFPRTGIEFRVAAPGGGPRVLSVDELERVRDGLFGRLSEARAALGERTAGEDEKRALIERMSAHPDSYKWIRVSNEDIGEPGCRHWHSRPRWGVLGMLLGWWRVKVSSGCPLAEGPAAGGSRTKSRAEWRRSGSEGSAGPRLRNRVGRNVASSGASAALPKAWQPAAPGRGAEEAAVALHRRRGARFLSPRSSSSSPWCSSC
jgi:hypothetical protein